MQKSQQQPTAWLDLSTASEGGLLEFALGLYKLNHDNEKAKYAFAKAIDRTEAHIDQCLVNKAHIGTVNWLKIQRLLPVKLFDNWLELQQQSLVFPLNEVKK